MMFTGIGAIQSLADDVKAKSFVIHEKGVKSRSLRQRSVGSTTKVKTELQKFADVEEYKNAQYYIMLFDTETVPSSSRESKAAATGEFSLGLPNIPVINDQYLTNPTVTGFSIGELEQRAGQIAENAILKYKIEQKDKEIKDLETEIQEPDNDYMSTIIGALSSVLGNKMPPQAPANAPAVSGMPLTNGLETKKDLKTSLKRLEKCVGGKKNLEKKLSVLADKIEKTPMLIDLL